MIFNDLFTSVANMFDKFAARDAKNEARAQRSLNKDGKDVFARAEEEAKVTLGEEAETKSTDVAANEAESNNAAPNETGSVNDGSEKKYETSTTTEHKGKYVPNLSPCFYRLAKLM